MKYRGLVVYDNIPARSVVANRKALAKLLGVPWEDLLADLWITVEISRYPRHRKSSKYIGTGGPCANARRGAE